MKNLPKLPIESCLDSLTAALNEAGAAVLQAPTGTGKTTRVPIALWQAGFAGRGQIWVLQPRRVAARATAAIMAAQLGESLGQTVGYHIRFDRKAGPATKILVVTEGILSRKLLHDPLLEGINCVILDEFHERSLHTDLGLAFIQELRGIRDDLKFLVMSATLDPAPLRQYLGNCPFVSVEAPTHPLNIEYGDDRPIREIPSEIAKALQRLFGENDDGGDVLVFLPGVPEIHRVMRYLEPLNLPAKVYALHGGLSAQEQDQVIRSAKERRIILATNVAETSLTIPGIRAVIDSGYRKWAIFDPGKGMDRLDLCRISQASATQRAGRAGRLGPGRVIRLWSEQRHHLLEAHDLPEMMRGDLCAFLLQILDFHGPDLQSFPFFQKPPQEAVDRTLGLLRMLGAITEGDRLSPLGQSLSRLPLHPRIGAMLVKASELGFLEAGAVWCALLSERSQGRGTQVFSELWSQYQAWEASGQAGEPAFPKVKKAAKQLERLAKKLNLKGSARQSMASVLSRALLAGYPDRVCRKRGNDAGVMIGGRGVQFQIPAHHEIAGILLALDLREVGSRRTAAKVSLIQGVSIEIIREVFALEPRAIYRFDPESESVTGRSCLSFEGLVLQEKPLVAEDEVALAECLATAGCDYFKKIYQPDEATAGLVYRLRLAKTHLEAMDWPDVTEAGLKAMLREACYGKRRFAELKRLNWQQMILNQLNFKQRRLLDEALPERYRVPSGSERKIDYESAFNATGFPVLAVRLQECFGLSKTPTLANGRLPLLLHLLAPNMRPVQVTRDIVNFWNTTYTDVRKELRQRYPKHAWPENPWEAKALRGVPKRKNKREK